MKSMSELSHEFLKGALHRQAFCVDGTLGSGRDSAFFLEQGADLVCAYEVCEELYEQSCEKLASPHFHAFLKSHEFAGEDLEAAGRFVDAAVFNFGFDPRAITGSCTKAESSLKAVLAVLDAMKIRGRMSLVFYMHEEGQKEYRLIMDAINCRQDTDLLECRRCDHPGAPILVCVEKKKAVQPSEKGVKWN